MTRRNMYPNDLSKLEKRPPNWVVLDNTQNSKMHFRSTGGKVLLSKATTKPKRGCSSWFRMSEFVEFGFLSNLGFVLASFPVRKLKLQV